jgi:Spy/CpxP family protein refolding chaperone
MRLQAARKISVSVIAMITACACCPPLLAEPKGPAPGTVPGRAAPAVPGKPGLDVSKPYGYHLQPILDKINASSDQRVKITKVVASYRSSLQPLRDHYKEKQQDFISSMISGDAAEAVMSKQVELGHMASEITSKYCLMRLEIRRVLTPQQILLFESYGREHGWNH